MFVKNQWYAFAWDREVGRKPLGRTICGEPVVVYRKLDGELAALIDACPHRLLPLSMGLVEGDNLRCRYHGVLFNGQGQCIEMPGETQKKDALVAQTYPVVERHRFVWVWIGDADKADPALVPDLWPCSTQGWAFDGGGVRARIVIDRMLKAQAQAVTA